MPLSIIRREASLLSPIKRLQGGYITGFGILPIPKDHAFIALVVIRILIDGGISIAGTFVFLTEMRRFFRERDNPGMRLSPWMTLFFNVLCFQYYFHGIAVAQRGGLSITPAVA